MKLVFGIAGSIEVEVLKGYSITSNKSYDNTWVRLSNGDISSTDLGKEADMITSDIVAIGSMEDMMLLEDNLLDSKGDTITCECTDGEEIFGLEFDYTSPLECRLIKEPSYGYEDLNWVSLSFTLLLMPETRNYISQPIGDINSLPIDMGVSREYHSGNTDVILQDGSVVVYSNDTLAYIVNLRYDLTREEALFLKRFLVEKRTQKFYINNTYFNLVPGAVKPDTLYVNAKSVVEVRDSNNHYYIDVEYLFQ
jgi:hypothetical protein